MKNIQNSFNLSQPRVSNWKRRGVPLRYRLPLARLAIDFGIIPPADFLADLRGE